MRVRFFLFAVFLFALSLHAAPKHRAASKPAIDPSSVDGWLTLNAHLLDADHAIPYDLDLEPLRTMIGNATIVGLGDGTHGTHEFFTMKVRIVDFLARKANFDVVAFEGPFPLMNRMDAYVQGGAGNARELASAMKPLYYFFWNTEEMVSLLEWMRVYNMTRGDRPALRIAGFDIHEPYTASRDVLAYLREVDPAFAASAETSYSCLTPSSTLIRDACRNSAVSVLDALSAKEAQYTALTSVTAFRDAQQNARVITQSEEAFGSGRDGGMAANALWLRENRSATHKIIVWGHNAHIAELESQPAPYATMGKSLNTALGADYFSVAMLTAAGTFRQWDRVTNAQKTTAFAALTPAAIESDLRKRGQPRFLISLRGNVPEWLSAARRYNSSGIDGVSSFVDALPSQYDAAIFIDTTTPITDLP